MLRTIAVIASILLSVSDLCAQNEQGLLWEVRSPTGSVSHLFGTYHLHWLGVPRSAATGRKGLWQRHRCGGGKTEIDSTRFLKVARMGMMRQHTLSDFYDTAQYQIIDREMTRVAGIGLNSLLKLKPVNISMMYTLALAQEELSRSDMVYSGPPMDLHFASEARESGKSVHTLETMV
ncbi:MAG: TraB/GumN family protein [Owenweeksia sp.]|nr:TraB/GumN family protein [Owenweeksia sp.]